MSFIRLGSAFRARQMNNDVRRTSMHIRFRYFLVQFRDFILSNVIWRDRLSFVICILASVFRHQYQIFFYNSCFDCDQNLFVILQKVIICICLFFIFRIWWIKSANNSENAISTWQFWHIVGKKDRQKIILKGSRKKTINIYIYHIYNSYI